MTTKEQKLVKQYLKKHKPTICPPKYMVYYSHDSIVRGNPLANEKTPIYRQD